MRRSFVRPVTCLALLGLAGALFAYVDSPVNISSPTLTPEGKLTPRTRAVIADGNAYLLGQAETIVADAKIEKIAPSPMGDAVLVAASKRRPFRGIALTPADDEPTIGELNLVYWDTRTRTARTLLREAIREDSLAGIQKMEWLPQTRSALVVLLRIAIPDGKPGLSEQTTLRVDMTTGTVSRLASRESDSDNGPLAHENLEVSPSRPLAYTLLQEYPVAESRQVSRSSLRLYSPRGFGAPILLPDGIGPLQWTPDGKSVYADSILERNPEGKMKRRKAVTLVNLETGAVTHPDTLPVILKTARTKEPPSARESWAVDVATAPSNVQNPSGKAQTVSTLWLRGLASTTKEEMPVAKPAAGPISTDALLIATNARCEGELAAENSAAILFTRDGSLCAAPLFRLPIAAFEGALRGVQRTAAISNAKQAGLALLMYSQDYDENLPPIGGATAGQIGPYVRNPDIFQNPATGENGFVFSYQGPTSQAQIAEVAKTQLGYVSGPGGRAIIWADGHVTWENTP